MKKSIFFLASVGAAVFGLASCSSGNGGGAEAFETDSVRWADSLVMDGCRAKVDIKGLYPGSGKTALADSVRAWIGGRLEAGVYDNSGMRVSVSSLDDGNKLVEECGNTLMAFVRTDFDGFVADSIAVQYEFDFSFGPEFRSDSLLSYFFSAYLYTGGAHGGSLGVGQTFVANTGERLTAANIFEPESLPKVVEIVKESLWEQYFKENTEPGSSLGDMLLVNVDTLGLPAYPPVFAADGLEFTYQQYEIACYAAGMPSCTVPYDRLKPLMRPETARLLP